MHTTGKIEKPDVAIKHSAVLESRVVGFEPIVQARAERSHHGEEVRVTKPNVQGLAATVGNPAINASQEYR